MGEERMRILKMVEDGKIDVKEANNLLETLDGKKKKPKPKKRGKARFIKILVEEAGEEKVDISIPMVLAKSFMKFIPKSARSSLNDQDINVNEIIEMVEDGVEDGTLVNINDGEDHVIIKVE
jgi:hypothetical protein